MKSLLIVIGIVMLCTGGFLSLPQFTAPIEASAATNQVSGDYAEYTAARTMMSISTWGRRGAFILGGAFLIMGVMRKSPAPSRDGTR